jgi:4-hydroxy-tetrahydrodipicolinate synthase
VKDSNGDRASLEARCRTFPGKELFSGTDSMALAALQAGGNGVLSSLSNIAPGAVVALYEDWKSDDSAALQSRVDTIRATAEGLPYIPFLRAAKAWLSGDPSWRNTRPPIRQLTESEERLMRDRLTALGISPNRLAAE